MQSARYRVQLFAFSHCRDVVAAVTNAGGFGILVREFMEEFAAAAADMAQLTSE